MFAVQAKSRRLELIGVTVRPSTFAGAVESSVIPDLSSERVPIFPEASTAANFVVICGRSSQTSIKIRVCSWLR